MPHPMTGFYEGPTTRFILTARWLPFAARVHRSIDPRDFNRELGGYVTSPQSDLWTCHDFSHLNAAGSRSRVPFGSLSEPRAEVSHRKSGVATCTACSPPFSFAVSVSRRSRRLAPRLPAVLALASGIWWYMTRIGGRL
jgi:hypothetical protein